MPLPALAAGAAVAGGAVLRSGAVAVGRAGVQAVGRAGAAAVGRAGTQIAARVGAQAAGSVAGRAAGVAVARGVAQTAGRGAAGEAGGATAGGAVRTIQTSGGAGRGAAGRAGKTGRAVERPPQNTITRSVRVMRRVMNQKVGRDENKQGSPPLPIRDTLMLGGIAWGNDMATPLPLLITLIGVGIIAIGMGIESIGGLFGDGLMGWVAKKIISATGLTDAATMLGAAIATIGMLAQLALEIIFLFALFLFCLFHKVPIVGTWNFFFIGACVTLKMLPLVNLFPWNSAMVLLLFIFENKRRGYGLIGSIKNQSIMSLVPGKLAAAA